jgi:thiol-disulfide isomerase/thioredoxin
MKKQSKKLLNLLSALLLCGIVITSLHAATLDQPAPDFTLKSLSGKNLKLSEFKGNVVMLNFWASWCGPCRKEMPLLNELQKKYEALGFVILGVNVEQELELAKSFLKDTPVDFPVVFDSSNNVSQAYDVIAMPTTILIDRSGNMRYLHKGYKAGDEEKYRKLVKQLVRE